jgi:mono/diheme cytochrome c family protein
MWAINLKIGAVVIGTLALYTLVANAIPQVQSEVPRQITLGPNVTPDELVQIGEQIYNGAGGCTACHGLGTRAPNLLADERGTGLIGARCANRVRGKNCKEYLYESLTQPGAFVVPGYQPIMPDVTRQLPPAQVWALVAFLEAQGGTVDVSSADIPAAAPTQAPTPSGGGGGVGGGTTDPRELLRAGGCVGCHKLGDEGAPVGPELTRIGATRTAEQIRRGILEPDAEVAPGYEALKGVMPKTFGDQFTAAQLEALVRFLASQR